MGEASALTDGLPISVSVEKIDPQHVNLRVNRFYWLSPMQVDAVGVNLSGITSTTSYINVLAVDLTIENHLIERAIDINCAIVGPDGKYYAPESVAEGLEQSENLYNQTIPPNNSLTGELAFEVPRDIHDSWLDCNHGLKVKLQ